MRQRAGNIPRRYFMECTRTGAAYQIIIYHDKALAYMKGMGDVSFTRGKELAEYWKATYLT